MSSPTTITRTCPSLLPYSSEVPRWLRRSPACDLRSRGRRANSSFAECLFCLQCMHVPRPFSQQRTCSRRHSSTIAAGHKPPSSADSAKFKDLSGASLLSGLVHPLALYGRSSFENPWDGVDKFLA